MRDDGCLIWETRVSQFLHEIRTSCRVRCCPVVASTMAGERRDKLAHFLGVNLEGEGEEGEDRVAQSFGKTDPWRQCKNGINGILDVLMAEDADLAVPSEEDCDLQVAGLLVGELVGRSSLGLVERTAIKTFVRLVRPGTKAEYEDGVKAVMAYFQGQEITVGGQGFIVNYELSGLRSAVVLATEQHRKHRPVLTPRLVWPARAAQAADQPRLVGARGSLRRDLALRGASAEPADRSLCRRVFDTGVSRWSSQSRSAPPSLSSRAAASAAAHSSA